MIDSQHDESDRLIGVALGAGLRFNYRRGWRGLIDRVRILIAMPVFDRGYVVSVYKNPHRPVPVIRVPLAGAIRVCSGIEEHVRMADVHRPQNLVSAPTPPPPVHDGSGGES